MLLGGSFLLFMFRVCLVFLSVHCSLVVTCWERADLLTLLFVMFYCAFVAVPCVVLCSPRIRKLNMYKRWFNELEAYVSPHRKLYFNKICGIPCDKVFILVDLDHFPFHLSVMAHG